MAAEESSQGTALGPDISQERGHRPADQAVPDLNDVLGEFMEAISIIQVVSHVLMEASEDAPEPVGFCALALKHGCRLLDAAYTRFDEALIGYAASGKDPLDELDKVPGADVGRDDAGPASKRARITKGVKRKARSVRKQKRLALVG
jgi:hypothetical protein